MFELSASSLEKKDCYPDRDSQNTALVRSKSVRKSVRKSVGRLKKKFNQVVTSPEYKEAKTVHTFFNLLAPHWNWKEYSLLD